jgi:ribosomal protein S18 acetylase RimI-like enzyme
MVEMPLPILQTRAEPSGGDLMRLFDKTEFHLAQQLGEEEWLGCGAAFADAGLPSVQGANHVRQAALPEGMTAAEAVREVGAYFERRGTRCQYWAMNPAAEEGRVRPLVEYLTGAGCRAEGTDVMCLRRRPAGVVRESGGLTIIPARASYRHARQIAEEAARERGGEAGLAERVEANLRRLDDPRCEGILALKDGRAVGRAYVVTVGELGRLEWVYVAKEHRGQGVGRTILSRAMEACARSMFRHVFLGVDAQNAVAVGLYRRFGFDRVGEVVKYRTPL